MLVFVLSWIVLAPIFLFHYRNTLLCSIRRSLKSQIAWLSAAMISELLTTISLMVLNVLLAASIIVLINKFAIVYSYMYESFFATIDSIVVR